MASLLDKHPALTVFAVVGLLGAALLTVAERHVTHSVSSGLGDEYDEIATNLLRRHTYSASTHHPDYPTVTRGPVYPLYVAAVFSVFGIGNAHAVRYCDVVVHAVTAALLVALLIRMLSPRTALFAGLIYALWPTTMYYVAKGSSETMLCFWIVAALYACVRVRATSSWHWPALLGAALAVACLTRGVAVIFVMVAGTWMLSRVIAGRLRFGSLVALVLAWTLVMSPWWVRNYRLTGRFVPFHTLLWYNAYHDDVYDSCHQWLSSRGLIHADWRTVDRQAHPDAIVDYPAGFEYPAGLHAVDDIAQESRYRELVLAQMRGGHYLIAKALRNVVDFWSAAVTVFKTRLLLATSIVWLLLFVGGIVWASRVAALRWLISMSVAVVLMMWALYLPFFAIFRHSIPAAPFIAATIGCGLYAWSQRRSSHAQADGTLEG